MTDTQKYVRGKGAKGERRKGKIKFYTDFSSFSKKLLFWSRVLLEK